MDALFYQAVIEQSPVAFAYHKIVLDGAGVPCDFIFLQVNRAFEEMTGLRRENILGKKAAEVTPGIMGEKFDFIAAYGDIALRGGTAEFEQYSAGPNRWYRIQAFSPEHGCFAVQLLDISREKRQIQERDRLMEQLRENERMFHDIIENLPVALDIVTPDGTVVFANEVGLKLFEIEGDVSAAPNARSLWVDPEERLQFAAAIAHNGLVKGREVQLQTETGRKLWALVSGIRIRYQGQPCTLTAAHDISDRKAMESALKESENKFRLIFEHAAESILVVQDGEIQICNSVTQRMTGYSAEELIRMSFFDLFHPEDRERAVKTYRERFTDEGIVRKPHYQIVRKDGETVWIEAKGVRTTWNGLPALQYFMVDITEQKRAELALQASEEKYRLIAEFASDLIWVYNYSQHRFTYVSPSIIRLLGYTPEEALAMGIEGMVPEEFRPKIQAAAESHVREFLNDPDAGRTYILEMQNFQKSGGRIWVELSSRYRFNTNREIEIVGMTRDIEERRRSEQEVLFLSYHDQLTGLYNRRFYEEELRRLDTERNLPLTLILADVNGLKLTNDAFGHLAGDQLLIRTSQILKQECREDDILARIGGDEFVFLLPGAGQAEAQGMILRIKKALKEASDDKIVLSAAFGTATKTIQKQTTEGIFVDAENAMYRQKLSESNKVRSEAIKVITQVFYDKNREEEAHNKRVGQLSGKIAGAMDMSEEAVREIITAGDLHDIGKINMDQKLLTKSPPFTPQEQEEYERHPETGYQILKASAEFAQIAQYVLSHHEWMDGSGYPRGLAGEEIPLQSRIISVADAFDSMVCPRGDHIGMSPAAAIEDLKKRGNTQFDGNVVRAFEEKVVSQLGAQARDASRNRRFEFYN